MSSSNPIRAARERAALQRGGGRPFEPGNDAAVVHGGHREIVEERLERRRAELSEIMAAAAPLRAPDGSLPAADRHLVGLLARASCRLENIEVYLDVHGVVDGEGNLRPAVELERKLRQECADHADALAMSPRSRARLGLDVARTLDVASALSAAREEQDPAIRRALLRAAGLEVDGDGPGRHGDAGEAADG